MVRVQTLISADEIRGRVRALAKQISADYAASPDLVLVGVLRGSVCFLADLMREIDLPLRFDCIGLKSYAGTEGGTPIVTTELIDVVAGADVLLVEDIVERGTTLRAALDAVSALGPRSLEICALLRKAIAGQGPLPPARYIGFEIGPEFVVGYGLDYNQRFRNLPCIAIPSPADLAAAGATRNP